MNDEPPCNLFHVFYFLPVLIESNCNKTPKYIFFKKKKKWVGEYVNSVLPLGLEY